MAENPLGTMILRAMAQHEMEQRHRALLARFAHLSTDTLKAMWDRCDGCTAPEGEPDVDELHALLNARGEGVYCAV